MPQPEALHAETLARLHEVDRALASHAQWLARFNRQLICGGQPNLDDLQENAHLLCGLGQWLHADANLHPDIEPGLAALQVAHQSLHGIARHLLLAQAASQPISPDDYDALVAVAGRIRQLLRRLEQELMERLGAVDKLTGVWNRQAVNLRLAEEVERVQRTRQPCTICFVDLDNFARINDDHGHRAGDTVLKAVATFFASHLRGYDTIYRVGGEEFLLCLPTTDLDQAGTLLNRLREDLAATDFLVEEKNVRLTASFGVVSLDPIFFIDETLERVERAQLIARSEGGNRVCLWRDGFSEE